MNETTPPPGTPNGAGQQNGPHGPTGPAPQSGRNGLDGFFAWLRGLDITRGDDRWFAGVAGGIAAKANIDPIIVRGVFVVLAILGGPGILLYLAGWLLLPDSANRIHFEDLVRGRASTGVIVTAVILGAVIVLPVFFGLMPALFTGGWWGAWDLLPDWMSLTLGIIWWAVVLPGLIIWLIVWLAGGGAKRASQGSKGEDRAPAGAGAQPATASFSSGPDGTVPTTPLGEGPQAFASGSPSGAATLGEPAGRKADQWSADFERKAESWSANLDQQAQEWEQKAEAHYEQYGLGAGHVVITLACALLAAGAVAAWGIASSVSGQTALIAGLIAAVAVLGLSMIVAGIRGRSSGWVGFLAFIGVIALVFSPLSVISMPEHTEVVPFGNASIRPSLDGESRGLVVVAGNSTVDLRDLERRDAPGAVEVWALAGNVTVLLPDSHPTQVRVNLMAGNIRDLRLDSEDRRQGGIFMSRSISAGDQLSSAGVQATQVRVRLLAGNVYVEGGDRLEGLSANEREEIERLRQQIDEYEERLRERQREWQSGRANEMEDAR